MIRHLWRFAAGLLVGLTIGVIAATVIGGSPL